MYLLTYVLSYLLTYLLSAVIGAMSLFDSRENDNEPLFFTSTTPLFLYSAPKKYFFVPTTKHNGAQKSKTKK